jgi:hypothetical protein
MNSRTRFTIRRTAHGFAIYDLALGEFVSWHKHMFKAVRAVRQMRECRRLSRAAAESTVVSH